MFANDSLPKDGAELVPLNTGILLYGGESEQRGAGGGFALHSFSMVARDGEAVSGKVIEGGFGGAIAWAPDAPLLPTTTYDVLVQTGASGDTSYVEGLGLLWDYTFSFTTGTDLLPALSFAGPLTAEIVVGEKDSYPAECYGGCGGSVQPCTSNGKVATVEAVVHIPAIAGGSFGAGYRGVIDYTADVPSGLGMDAGRPPEDPLLSVAYFDAPAEQTVSVAVPRLTSGTPCYQVVVWDPAGQSATTSVCLPEVDVDALLADKNAEIAARGDAPTPAPNAATGEGDDAPNDVASTSGDCSVAPTSTSTSNGVFATLLLAVAAAFTRRRNQG